jgi:hypothetical protein
VSLVPLFSKQSILKCPPFLPDNAARVFHVCKCLVNGLKDWNLPKIFEIIGRPLMEQRGGFRSLVPLADIGIMGFEVMNTFLFS